MKSKMLIAALCLGIVSEQWAMSQTDTNSVATNQPTMSEPAPAAQPAETAAAGATNATDNLATSNAPAMNAPSAESASAEGTNETAGANPPAVTPAAVLPIQFQDVPITTAIENLARLADINYLLDPSIGYGQPDQNGQVKPEPTISVRWENVSPRQALLAVLDNYNLQLVEDPRTKIARITVRNPNAPPPLITRVIQLKYASVTNIMNAIDPALTDKRSRVVPDSRTSQLVVVATDKEQDAVDTLVAQLDKPTRQVLIETRLMDVSSTPSTKKGVDWTGTLSGQNVSYGNVSQFLVQPTLGTNGNIIPGLVSGVLGSPSLIGSTATPGFFPSPYFLNADGLKAVLSFLNQNADAQVIATPRVVTLDNESAHIEVTRAEPIFATTAGTQGSPGGSSVTYTNLGTILDVTPRISANDYIWLTVVPEVSDDAGPLSLTVAGVINEAEMYDVRKITTQVLIPNANTLVMGGFIKDNTQNGYTKVPILGDIPVLGYAFRSENKGLQKENLLIFITPTIIKDSDFQPTTTTFMQSSPMEPEAPMNPRSVWSSSKPYDWSNPRNTDPYYNAASPPPIDVETTNNAAGL
ncbi:MAG TPA: secretin N-terminal domain-containing protein [Candidatus Saccharimonadales bacterium]|nr:secretin N-terminal domain-containing protein [Candidatus Saccharimonadales bacterium]